MGRRSVLAAVVVASLAAGCSGDDDPGPGATVPQGTTASSPSSDTSSSAPAIPDVSVIPATLDKPYLEAILKALDEVDGQATRLIKSTRNYPPEAVDRLKAIFSKDAYLEEEQLRLEAIGDDPQLTGILASPGNRITTVSRVIAASPGCVWMAVQRDRSAVNVRPGPNDRIEYLAIEPLDRSNDPRKLNPTAWMISLDRFQPDGTEPENPCP